NVFDTNNPVIIYPASGTGVWEAALMNTLSPGDNVLMYETGWFSTLWARLAAKFKLKAEVISSDWRAGVDAEMIAARLRADKAHSIKAVCVVHNETSTGALSNIASVRKALDSTGHPALLLVDAISSLGSAEFKFDEWGVDVAISCSQKGLMLPPGLGFNAISEKALHASKTSMFPKAFWAWDEMLAFNKDGFFPSTPATNLLQGLRVALNMLNSEGLENVYLRHGRAASATRAAVEHWQLATQCQSQEDHSPVLTAVVLPEGHSADRVRQIILERANMSLGSGLGKLADRVFRIGHLGDFNDTSVLASIATVEMGLRAAGVPIQTGGVEAATRELLGNFEGFPDKNIN
ncbi:aminotransferase class V-fold PLP-dependent enzyme, partial [Paraburkholderia aspalathi]|nr:aminotransferase class V-fold PLP-dependent enzyme [Paraburkholderia aspalathi]